MARVRQKNPRASDQWPELVAKLRQSERTKKRTADPEWITLRSGRGVKM